MPNRRTFVDYSLNQIEFEALCYNAMLYMSKHYNIHNWTMFKSTLNKEFGIDFDTLSDSDWKFKTWYKNCAVNFEKVGRSTYNFIKK